jgi:hypothetical protein
MIWIGNVDLGMHGPSVFSHVNGKSRDSAGKVVVERRHVYRHGIADMNVTNIGFGHRDHQTEQIVLGQLH